MKTHRELIINWLRGKGFHRNDIASALDWLDNEVKSGREPKDNEILNIAQKCQNIAIDENIDIEPTVIKYVVQTSGNTMIVESLIGVISGILGVVMTLIFTGAF